MMRAKDEEFVENTKAKTAATAPKSTASTAVTTNEGIDKETRACEDVTIIIVIIIKIRCFRDKWTVPIHAEALVLEMLNTRSNVSYSMEGDQR